MRSLSECQLRNLYPENYDFCDKVSNKYFLSTCNSDSSSSIFLLPFIAIIPIHMEIPIFIRGKKKSVYKMMAKVIGKNVRLKIYLVLMILFQIFIVFRAYFWSKWRIIAPMRFLNRSITPVKMDFKVQIQIITMCKICGSSLPKSSANCKWIKSRAPKTH